MLENTDDFQMMEKYCLLTLVKLIIKNTQLRQCQFQQTREWIQLTYIKLVIFKVTCEDRCYKIYRF